MNHDASASDHLCGGLVDVIEPADQLGDTTIRLVLESGVATAVDPGMVAIDEVVRATTVLPTVTPTVRAVGPASTPADAWQRPPADRDSTQ